MKQKPNAVQDVIDSIPTDLKTQKNYCVNNLQDVKLNFVHLLELPNESLGQISPAQKSGVTHPYQPDQAE